MDHCLLKSKNLKEYNALDKINLRVKSMCAKQPELHWLQSVYEKCESVGVSRTTIERFSKFYLNEGNEKNDRLIATSERTKGTCK